MISVAEALGHIRSRHRDFGTESIPLHSCGGRILAEDVFADRDFPPYDRITMDGIAIRYASWESGRRTFPVEALQPAGHPQSSLLNEAACIEVMTGAILPLGADMVIPYEDCDISQGLASVSISVVRKLQNVHLQGTDGKAGDLLISRNQRITPAMIGVMATVGRQQVLVRKLPRTAVCSTGDELVKISDTPALHQIRRSNSYMLAAALAEEGIRGDIYHLPDEPGMMKAQLIELLQGYDAIIFSGAVSKGKFDFLPEVLAGSGMQTIFHRVAQRPGKPLLFGAFPGGPVVFGLPGNPASTLVSYAIFFKAWLRESLQDAAAQLSAVLTADVDFAPALTYHLPVSIRLAGGRLEATPCAGANSGDMVSLQRAEAVMSLPPDRRRFYAGEAHPLTLLAPFQPTAFV